MPALTAAQPMTLSVRQAAAYTGISRLRIECAVRTGELPAARIVSGKGVGIRIVRAHLEQWVLSLTEVPA